MVFKQGFEWVYMWDSTAREHDKLGLTSLFSIFLHTANAEHTTPSKTTVCQKLCLQSI